MCENSQASKNQMIYEVLEKTAAKYGHTTFNYGKYSESDENGKTYVQIGFLAALVLNAGAADFVVTGCGSGQGVMTVCNSFPGVVCGLIEDPCDAVLFMRVNNGNAVSLPFAKGFGWGAELNLKFIFERLFQTEPGSGYPEEWAEEEREGKRCLDDLKKLTHREFLCILEKMDPGFVGQAVAGEQVWRQLMENGRNEDVKAFLKTLKDDK